MTSRFIVAALILRADECLITQRKTQDEFGEYWEFPGGEVEGGESPRSALKREILEELGVKIKVVNIQDLVSFRYPNIQLLLVLYRCTIESGQLEPIEVQDIRWTKLESLHCYEFPPADRDLIHRLVNYYRTSEL